MAENSLQPKPFQLVKFFSFTSLVVFLFSTFILSWVISDNAKSVLIKRSEAYVQLIAEKMNQQIVQQFVLPTVLIFGKIELRTPVQFERLDSIVRSFTKGLKVESVTIFDSKTNIISYSTVTKKIGKENIGKGEYREALTGRPVSTLDAKGSVFSLLPSTPDVSCRIRTFFPIRQSDTPTGHVLGVLEIVQDLSEDLTAIIRLQAKIILFSSVIMAVLFLALRHIVSRADRIIEARNSDWRKLTEKLHQAERLAGLGKMIAAVSHEIKNPLGIIRSTAELLAKRMQKEDNGHHLATIIVNETSRLNRIVVEFLDFARPQTPQMARIDLADILSRAMEFIAPECEVRKISVTFEVDGSPFWIQGDPDLIYRVFLNILVNGVQAMENGGTLTVVIGRAQKNNHNCIHISVTDSGYGIKETDLQHIFHPFFTTKHQGTGLGLAIVKNIVDSHHGLIEVGNNGGAVFNIYFF